MFIFGEHKLSFYNSTVLWFRKYDVFYFSPDNTIEVSRDFWVGPLHPELAPYHVLRAMGLVNVETKRF